MFRQTSLKFSSNEFSYGCVVHPVVDWRVLWRVNMPYVISSALEHTLLIPTTGRQACWWSWHKEHVKVNIYYLCRAGDSHQFTSHRSQSVAGHVSVYGALVSCIQCRWSEGSSTVTMQIFVLYSTLRETVGSFGISLRFHKTSVSRPLYIDVLN
jgi:hypothetical protein